MSLQRSLFGMSWPWDPIQSFINMFSCNGTGMEQMGFSDITDEQGWINQPGHTSAIFGFLVIGVQPPIHYPGRYIMVGRGDGEVRMNQSGEGYGWTLVPAECVGYVSSPLPNCYTVQAQNTHESTDAAPPWKLVFTRNDHQATPFPAYGTQIHFTNSDYASRGYYIKDVCLCREDDYADWKAGKIWRKPYKDMIIKLNPAWIRYQIMNGVLDLAWQVRFRDRGTAGTVASPNAMIWGTNRAQILPYTTAVRSFVAGTGEPLYTVAGVAGTPANMKHGEMVRVEIPEDWETAQGTKAQQANGPSITVTNITLVNYDAGTGVAPVVTTATPHGFIVGETVYISTTSPTGSPWKYFDSSTIQVVAVPSPTTFTVVAFTAAYPAFPGGAVVQVNYGMTGNVAGIEFKANPIVTLLRGRRWHVGDKLLAHNFFDNAGCMELNDRIVTITERIDNCHYKIDIDTTGFWPIIAPYGGLSILAYMKVGTGGTRDGPSGKGFPILCQGGYVPVGASFSNVFGGVHPTSGYINVRTMYFHKDVGAYRNAAGDVAQWGAWCGLFPSQWYDGSLFPITNLLPVEFQVKLHVELEERIIETGQQDTKGPINPWYCLPCMGMLSIDPDYDPLDNYAIGFAKASFEGINGWPKLPGRCSIAIENANESFNAGVCTSYHYAQSWWRWRGNSWTDGTMMRSIHMWRDIELAYPAEKHRLKRVMAQWDFGIKGKAYHDSGNGTFGGGDYVVFATRGTCGAMGDGETTGAYLVPPLYATWYHAQYPGRTPGDVHFAFTNKVPPEASAPYWPTDRDPTKCFAANYDYVSPGYYHIPTAHWHNLHFVSATAGYAAAGNVVQLASHAVNSADPYTTNIVSTTPHQFNDGDLVIFTDVVQIWGDQRLIELWPFVVTNSNKAGKTFTINMDSNQLGGVGSANIMHFRNAAQEPYLTEFMNFMYNDEGPYLDSNKQMLDYNGKHVNIPWMRANFRNYVARLREQPELAHVKIASYEGAPEIHQGYTRGLAQFNSSYYGGLVTSAVPTCTDGQVLAFWRAVYYSNRKGEAQRDYLALPTEEEFRDDIECMSDLTIIAWQGARWGFTLGNPWVAGTRNAPEWSAIPPAQIAAGVFNDSTITGPGLEAPTVSALSVGATPNLLIDFHTPPVAGRKVYLKLNGMPINIGGIGYHAITTPEAASGATTITFNAMPTLTPGTYAVEAKYDTSTWGPMFAMTIT